MFYEFFDHKLLLLIQRSLPMFPHFLFVDWVVTAFKDHVLRPKHTAAVFIDCMSVGEISSCGFSLKIH